MCVLTHGFPHRSSSPFPSAEGDPGAGRGTLGGGKLLSWSSQGGWRAGELAFGGGLSCKLGGVQGYSQGSLQLLLLPPSAPSSPPPQREPAPTLPVSQTPALSLLAGPRADVTSEGCLHPTSPELDACKPQLLKKKTHLLLITFGAGPRRHHKRMEFGIFA